MINKDIVKQVEDAFYGWKQPSTIYSIEQGSAITHEMKSIQKDFESTSVNDMNKSQISMMVCDSSMINDEAYCYYLPALTKAVIQRNASAFLFYSRLSKIDREILNTRQKEVLNQLIEIAKSIESELVEENNEEVLNSWKVWKDKMSQDDSVQSRAFLAVYEGDLQYIEDLISSNHDLLQAKDFYGNTLLEIAEMRDKKEIVKVISTSS